MNSPFAIGQETRNTQIFASSSWKSEGKKLLKTSLADLKEKEKWVEWIYSSPFFINEEGLEERIKRKHEVSALVNLVMQPNYIVPFCENSLISLNEHILFSIFTYFFEFHVKRESLNQKEIENLFDNASHYILGPLEIENEKIIYLKLLVLENPFLIKSNDEKLFLTGFEKVFHLRILHNKAYQESLQFCEYFAALTIILNFSKSLALSSWEKEWNLGNYSDLDKNEHHRIKSILSPLITHKADLMEAYNVVERVINPSPDMLNQMHYRGLVLNCSQEILTGISLLFIRKNEDFQVFCSHFIGLFKLRKDEFISIENLTNFKINITNFNCYFEGYFSVNFLASIIKSLDKLFDLMLKPKNNHEHSFLISNEVICTSKFLLINNIINEPISTVNSLLDFQTCFNKVEKHANRWILIHIVSKLSSFYLNSKFTFLLDSVAVFLNNLKEIETNTRLVLILRFINGSFFSIHKQRAITNIAIKKELHFINDLSNSKLTKFTEVWEKLTKGNQKKIQDLLAENASSSENTESLFFIAVFSEECPLIPLTSHLIAEIDKSRAYFPDYNEYKKLMGLFKSIPKDLLKEYFLNNKIQNLLEIFIIIPKKFQAAFIEMCSHFSLKGIHRLFCDVSITKSIIEKCLNLPLITPQQFSFILSVCFYEENVSDHSINFFWEFSQSLKYAQFELISQAIPLLKLEHDLIYSLSFMKKIMNDDLTSFLYNEDFKTQKGFRNFMVLNSLLKKAASVTVEEFQFHLSLIPMSKSLNEAKAFFHVGNSTDFDFERINEFFKSLKEILPHESHDRFFECLHEIEAEGLKNLDALLSPRDTLAPVKHLTKIQITAYIQFYAYYPPNNFLPRFKEEFLESIKNFEKQLLLPVLIKILVDRDQTPSMELIKNLMNLLKMEENLVEHYEKWMLGFKGHSKARFHIFTISKLFPETKREIINKSVADWFELSPDDHQVDYIINQARLQKIESFRSTENHRMLLKQLPLEQRSVFFESLVKVQKAGASNLLRPEWIQETSFRQFLSTEGKGVVLGLATDLQPATLEELISFYETEQPTVNRAILMIKTLKLISSEDIKIKNLYVISKLLDLLKFEKFEGSYPIRIFFEFKRIVELIPPDQRMNYFIRMKETLRKTDFLSNPGKVFADFIWIPPNLDEKIILLLKQKGAGFFKSVAVKDFIAHESQLLNEIRNHISLHFNYTTNTPYTVNFLRNFIRDAAFIGFSENDPIVLKAHQTLKSYEFDKSDLVRKDRDEDLDELQLAKKK